MLSAVSVNKACCAVLMLAKSGNQRSPKIIVILQYCANNENERA
jgi:hypothetical protein